MICSRVVPAVLFLALGATASAADEAKSTALGNLPSPPGAHIGKIKALGDNQWLSLGAPAADPIWGKARGRAWGAKAFVFARNLRGAFFFGEGVHAFVKPDGHAQDDLWFYDINAHRWICLYPGTNPKTFNQRVAKKELLIDDNGQLTDHEGQPVPVHTSGHAWGNLTYDSDRNKFAFITASGNFSRYFLGGEKQMDEGLKQLESQVQTRKNSVLSPWYYDVASGKFERSVATGSMGDLRMFPQLNYIPGQKRFIVVGANGVAIFEPANNHWSDAHPKGPAPRGYDRPGCYDSRRNRIYSNEGDSSEGQGLMAYDIEKNLWIELKPRGVAPAADDTNGAFYEYDSRLDRVVAIHFRGKTPGVFTYDPQANSWSGPLPFPIDGPKFSFAANTCYDSDLNACICHVAGDSEDNGIVWAYRYKRHD